MRTIKFRGKRLDNGKWVYGYLADENYINDIDTVDMSSIEVDKDTVGQYTGWVDINGKEIYEGDIIESKGLDGLPLRHIVVYAQDVASFIVQLARAYDCSSINQDWIFNYLKAVVGNIHDNPELLEGGNE